MVVHSATASSPGSADPAQLGTSVLKPTVSADQAIVEAGARFGSHFQGAPNSRLVVYALGASPVLAHEVVFSGVKADQTPTEMHYFVDARSGKLLNQWDEIHVAKPGPGGSTCAGTAATGSGKTLMIGNVAITTTKCSATSYELRDPTRGGGWHHQHGDEDRRPRYRLHRLRQRLGQQPHQQLATAAADAQYGIATTWDYYKNVHGRNGIANDGVGALSRVHYGRNYANAFWSDACFCMTFGDGDNGASIYPLVSLDVASHEMSHGVMSRTADLIYSGESGGLNEANSGHLRHHGGVLRQFGGGPGGLRDRRRAVPEQREHAQCHPLDVQAQPRRCLVRLLCVPNIGSDDVHFSSGVANRFFYLLAEGAVVPTGFGAGTWANLTPSSLVCNGNTSITGIGRSAAEKIWYRAITVYMTASTNYAGARAATLSAATDLYGMGSTQYNAVAAHGARSASTDDHRA